MVRVGQSPGDLVGDQAAQRVPEQMEGTVGLPVQHLADQRPRHLLHAARAVKPVATRPRREHREDGLSGVEVRQQAPRGQQRRLVGVDAEQCRLCARPHLDECLVAHSQSRPVLGDQRGVRGDRHRASEEAAQREANPQPVVHSGRDLRSQQRVATSGEEVLVARDPPAEAGGPDGGQHLLGGVTRIGIGLRHLRGRSGGRRRSLPSRLGHTAPVDLPVRALQQTPDTNDPRRNEVVWQALGGPPTHSRGIGAPPRATTYATSVRSPAAGSPAATTATSARSGC